MFFDDGWDGRGQTGRQGNGHIDTRDWAWREARHAALPSLGAIFPDLNKMRGFKDSYSGSKNAEMYRGEWFRRQVWTREKYKITYTP